MTTTPVIAVSGTVTASVTLNVRHGEPNTAAPLTRKLAPGTVVSVQGLVIGETVQGNAHWYAIDNDDYVWTGGCSALAQPASPTAAPVPSTSSTGSSSVQEAGLEGFGLNEPFMSKLADLILACRAKGLMFRIAQGLRAPAVQAKYYCQWARRSPQEIDAVVLTLRGKGAPWTAELMASLRDAPRQPDWQTNALPGAGWHQWGEAADCYCYRDGQLVGNGSDPCYKAYADLAQQMGLTAGLFFSQSDPGHVQLRSAGGATDVYGWPYIDTVMKERFGEKPSLT